MVTMSGMPSGPARLLMIDFETSGLLDDWIWPTLLEAAWVIIDGMGEQISPLRHRFLRCRADGEETSLVLPRVLGTATDPATGHTDHFIDWDLRAVGLDSGADYPVAAVREMHEKSGLAREWALAEHHHPDWIVDGIGLEAALCADLDEHARDIEPGMLRLAGSGVAQFEARFLPDVAPRAMDAHEYPWHYRTADLSVELSNARLRGGTTTMDTLLDKAGPQQITVDPASRAQLSPGNRHRALTDVARAVWAWQTLARYGW
jgi:hypothetical protein